MEVIKWKLILEEWIKKTELVDVLGSIEHLNIDSFYVKFRDNIRRDVPTLQEDLKAFLDGHFPSFKIQYDEENNISSQDFMYIFSLMLYYSCVVKVNEFFQKCCEGLNIKHQPTVLKFFACLKSALDKKEPITRDVIRAAIKEASPSPLHLKFISSSPMATPDKMAQTPVKLNFIERSKELHHTKTLLDNERYERNMLEAELKQSEEKVHKLVKEQKSLKQELQKIKQDQLIDRDNENLSPNKVIRDEQIRIRMQKEIDARDNIIVDLRCEIEFLTTKQEQSKNRMTAMEHDSKELSESFNIHLIHADELKNIVEAKSSQIETLEENLRELQGILSEIRRSSSNTKDSSSECLDYSFTTANMTENTSFAGENLAQCVIDVQLKEKEIENHELMNKLTSLNNEKELLESAITAHGETIDRLQREISDKSTSNEKLSSEQKELATQIKSLMKENENLKKGIHQSSQKIEEIQNGIKDQMDGVNRQLKAAQDAREEFQNLLEAEKFNFKSLRDEHEQKISEQNQEIETIRRKIQEKAAELNEKTEQIVSQELHHKSEIDRLVKKGKEDIESIVKAKDMTLVKIESSLQSKLKKSEDTKRSMEESFKSKLHHTTENLKTLNEKIETQNQKIVAFETSMAQIEQEKTNLIKEIEEKSQQITLISQINSEKQEELSQKIIALEKESQLASSNAEEVKAELQAKEEVLAEATMAKAACEANLVEIQSENASLTEKLNQLKLELDDALKKSSNAEKTIEEVKNKSISDINELKQKLETAVEQVALKESEISQKIDEVNNLEIQVKESTKQIEKMVQTVEDLKQQNAEITTSLETANIEVAEKSKTIEDIQLTFDQTESVSKTEMIKQVNEIKTLQANIAELEKNLKAVVEEAALKKSEVTQKITEVEKFEVQMKESTKEIEKMVETVNDLKQQNAEITNSLTKANIEAAEKSETIKNMNSTCDRNESDLNDSRAEVSRLNHEIEMLHVRISELEKNLAETVRDKTSIELKHEELSKTFESISNESSQLKTSLNLKEEKASKLENELVEATKSLSIATSSKQDLENSLKQMSEQAKQASSKNSQLTEKLEDLSKKIQSDKMALEEINKQQIKELEIVQRKLSDSEESNVELIATLNDLESKNAQLTTSINEKEAMLASLSDQESKVENEIKKFKVATDSLQQEVTKQNEEVSQLKQAIAEKELHIENIELEKSLFFEQRESVIRTKAIVDKELETIKEALDMKTSEIDQINAVILQKEEHLALAEKAVEKLRSEKEDLNERINKELDVTTMLKKKIETNEEMIGGLYVNIDELKDENKQLKEKIDAELQEKHEIEDIVTDLDDKLTNSKNELALKSSQVMMLEAEQKALKEAVSKSVEVKVNFEILQTRYNVLKERSDAMETEASSKDSLITQLKVDHESSVKRIDSLTNEGNHKNCELQEKIREYEEKAQQNQTAIEELQTKLNEAENERKNLILKVAETDRSLGEAKHNHLTQMSELQSTIENMKVEMDLKTSSLSEMVKQTEDIKARHTQQISSLERQLGAAKTSTSSDNEKAQMLLKKLENMSSIETDMEKLEQSHAKEKIYNEKLVKEHAVFGAKLAVARQENEELKKNFAEERKMLQDEMTKANRKFEEEMKEVRQEMSGKLEKMKEKMKSIYNEEMKKKNEKHDDQTTMLHGEIQKLEESLARQNFSFNELKLKSSELNRENEFMRGKLRFLETNKGMEVRESIGMSRPQMMHMNNGNFGMEDEAGEEFNNTYLLDLKNGGSQMSIDKPDLFSASELQKRNSMYPQHMRGSYAMYNTDKNLGEQEIKNGSSMLDDSQTALLQNAGNRKKQSTSYKRPGPPTPSKLGGRQSIGGTSDVHYSNILKESNNSDNATKKTPRAFKLFGSTKKIGDESNVKRSRNAKRSSLTPRQVTRARNNYESPFRATREELRREKRNRAREHNRPNFNESCSSPEYSILKDEDIDEDEWQDEEEAKKPLASRSRSSHNQSFEQIKQYEEWVKQQQLARHNCFSDNRKHSLGRLRQRIDPKKSMTPEDWEKYQSCMSLKSNDCSTRTSQTPKKAVTRNFMVSNHSEVNRLSDIFVIPSVHYEQLSHESKASSNITWRNVEFLVVGALIAYSVFYAFLFVKKD